MNKSKDPQSLRVKVHRFKGASKVIEAMINKIKVLWGKKVKTKDFENAGFPRIKYGAGLVKPGMTNEGTCETLQ